LELAKAQRAKSGKGSNIPSGSNWQKHTKQTDKPSKMFNRIAFDVMANF
jgi:hypothetical protein